MRTKIIILVCLITATLFLSYEYSWAKAKTQEVVSGPKIGVVSVVKILEDCKRNQRYWQQAVKERNNIEAELEKLAKELDAERAGIRTLKEGSSDYMALAKEILQKRAYLEAQQEFYKGHIELKNQRWTEELYKDVLKKIKQVALQKGLGMVFEKSEPELPAVNASELMLIIRTHKLLYNGNGLDITAEVMSQLDADG